MSIENNMDRSFLAIEEVGMVWSFDSKSTQKKKIVKNINHYFQKRKKKINHTLWSMLIDLQMKSILI